MMFFMLSVMTWLHGLKGIPGREEKERFVTAMRQEDKLFDMLFFGYPFFSTNQPKEITEFTRHKMLCVRYYNKT